MLTFPKLTIFPDTTMSWESATLVHLLTSRRFKAGSVDWTIEAAGVKKHFPRMSYPGWFRHCVRADNHFRLAQLLMIGSVGSGAVSLKDQPLSVHGHAQRLYMPKCTSFI
jgi:hypothetical protein